MTQEVKANVTDSTLIVEAALDESINYACEHLPERWEITLMIERGSGILILEDPECEEVGNDEFSEVTEEPLSAQLLNAVKYAIANDDLFE
jgi:hypothetical protein